MRRGLALDERFTLGLPTPLPLPDDCWNWQGLRNHYGLVPHGARNHYAHRMAYERWRGPIPDGFVVRHTCDNKFCVNPVHLILGKQSDNVADAVERGLNCRGERHGMRRLTEQQVREIKILLHSTNLSHRVIADRYPVTTSGIEAIAAGRTWKWVDPYAPDPTAKYPNTDDMLGCIKLPDGMTVDDVMDQIRGR